MFHTQELSNKEQIKTSRRVSDDIEGGFHLECARSPNLKYFVTRRLYIMFLPGHRNACLYNLAGHPATRQLCVCRARRRRPT